MVEAAFMHRWFDEVWNKKNDAAIDEMAHEAGTARNLGGMQTLTPDDFKKFRGSFIAAFPDLHVEVEDVIVDGDKLAARCRVTGTHDGDGLQIPATGKPVNFTGMTIVHVVDDKIVDAWNEFDFVTMYGQLGLAQPPQVLERNKAVVRDWFDKVWNAKEPALIDIIMTDETIHHGIAGVPDGQLKGREEFREFWNVMIKAFPDIHFDIKDVFSEGDKVGARYVATGTQTGPLLPDFPEATGRKVKFTGGGMCLLDDQGRFVEVWNEIDFGKMQQDLTSAV